MPSIILSDNGVSSGSAGLKETAGNDGVLVLQTTTAGGTATTAVTIDNNQNVGVGTTSILGNSTVNAVLGFAARNSGASAGYFQTYNSNAGTDLKTWRFGGNSSGNLVWETVNDAYSSATGRMTLNSNGVLALQGASTSANGVGITFPPTSIAHSSSNANTLDDYEEGTWTVTLTASTPGTLSVSYGNRAAWYTKIGRQVVAGFYLTWSMTKGTASGDILLSGLPFTAAVPFGGADAQTGFIGYVNSFPVSVCGLLQVYTTNNMYIGIANGGTAQITSFTDGTTYAVRGTYVFYV